MKRQLKHLLGGIIGFFAVVACPSYGQALQKQAVQEKDYNLWGTITLDKISNHGNWLSYTMDYNDNVDTLFVQNTNTKKILRFTNAGDGVFSGEDWFACLQESKRLQLLNLKTCNIIAEDSVTSYSFANGGKQIIVHYGNSKRKVLRVLNLASGVAQDIADVVNYEMSNNKDEFICTQKAGAGTKVLYVTIEKFLQIKTIAQSGVTNFTHLLWENQDRAFAFLATNTTTKNTTINYYGRSANHLYSFDPTQHKAATSGFRIREGYASGLAIAFSGDKVFFSMQRDSMVAKKFEGVQQWNTKDAVLYPEQKIIADAEYNTAAFQWFPHLNKLVGITNTTRPFFFLNGNQEYALSYNENNSVPENTSDRTHCYYATDLKNGISKLIVNNLSSSLAASSLSPRGGCWAYFKDDDWWIYNFNTAKLKNITKDLGMHFWNNDDPGWKTHSRVVGWGNKEECVFVNDGVDIWQIFLTGKAKRLTNGRESGMSFELVQSCPNAVATAHAGHIDCEVDLLKGILLKGRQTNKSSYFKLMSDGKLRIIVSDSLLNSSILQASDTDKYVYLSESYNTPPEVRYYNMNSAKLSKLFSSNSHHKKYLWGRQELIDYKNSYGVALQGLLYYPADYQPLKKYPMVVHIYEKQTDMKNNYFNPTVYNPTGLNISTLTANGYFVLMPDIIYGIGNPGISAADCVIAATNKVINSGLVQAGKIALMGQSFGGYETNFIMTQTDMFATAISSASIFDIENFYLSVSEITGRSEMWRFESQQWRMGKSLFEDRLAYERNSPLTYVQNIKAPILIWTGEFDKHADPDQSIALYLALRRLERDGILLVFPGDSHSLRNPENQRLLSGRVNDWLNYYLKDEIPAGWIREGLKLK